MCLSSLLRGGGSLLLAEAVDGSQVANHGDGGGQCHGQGGAGPGLTATTVTPETSMRRASSVVNRTSPSLEVLYAPQ